MKKFYLFNRPKLTLIISCSLIYALSFIVNAQQIQHADEADNIVQSAPITYAELSFMNERFLLLEDIHERKFKLLSAGLGKKNQEIELSEEQAQKIKIQATQIIWQARFKQHRGGLKNCEDFATVRLEGENKTRVCKENRRATAMSFTLLNSVRSLFH